MKKKDKKEKTRPQKAPLDSKLLPILHEGLEIVKLVTFQELKLAMAERYPSQTDQENAMFAGALINELFLTPNRNEQFVRFATDHAREIKKELKDLRTTISRLRPLLTDAIRIQFLCDSMEGCENHDLLQTAQDLDILETEREAPMPARFIHLVRTIGHSFGILAEG